jgi:hypothetical protein
MHGRKHQNHYSSRFAKGARPSISYQDLRGRAGAANSNHTCERQASGSFLGPLTVTEAPMFESDAPALWLQTAESETLALLAEARRLERGHSIVLAANSEVCRSLSRAAPVGNGENLWRTRRDYEHRHKLLALWSPHSVVGAADTTGIAVSFSLCGGCACSCGC